MALFLKIMQKTYTLPYVINSVSELHRLLELPKPAHPLVSVINMDNIKCHFDDNLTSVIYNFYSICIKKGFNGKLKYGQNYYDFDEGIMTFFSPGQVIATVVDNDTALSGWWLVVHPDFIRSHALGKTIKDYGYFSYATHEALHLSDKEEAMIAALMQNIDAEYQSVTDNFSHGVMISQIDLLLTYCNRFYSRQFITREQANSDLLVNLEQLLSDYFDSGTRSGLPTVQYISEQLHVSPNYLSDMLRTLTGQSTQQHIHNKLIEKAKEILTTTQLSVSEIAYQLGFEHPQSFSKLFKNKTDATPLAFRNSFN